MSAAPQLRGLLKSQLKRDFAITTVLCITAVSAWKFLIKDRRAKTYEEFYKTFDAQKEFLRMRDLGMFDSVKPGGGVGDGSW